MNTDLRFLGPLSPGHRPPPIAAPTPTTADLLRRAAWRVRQGWCQGCADDGFGNVCALGAMYEVSDTGRYYPLAEALLTVIGGQHIDGWNDAPHQTAESVALAFELAATVWEEQRARA